MKKYTKDYIIHLSTLIVSILLLLICGAYLEIITFFGVGYSWSLALVTPELEERVTNRKYKYSFFKLVFKLNNLIEIIFSKFNHRYKSYFIRVCSPLTFMLIIVLLGAGMKSLFVLVGWLIFEVIELYNDRYVRKH